MRKTTKYFDYTRKRADRSLIQMEWIEHVIHTTPFLIEDLKQEIMDENKIFPGYRYSPNRIFSKTGK
jgi:hypothetical protein